MSAVVLSAATMYFLLRTYHFKDGFAEILSGLPAQYIICLLLIMAGAWLADAFRLREVAGALGCQMPLKLSLGAVLAGNFSINITPFFAGAGFLHIYVLKRRGLELDKASAAIAGGAMISHATQAVLAFLSFIFIRSRDTGPQMLANKAVMAMILLYLVVILAIVVFIVLVEEPEHVFAFLFRKRAFAKISEALCSFHRGLRLLLKGNPWRLLRIFIFTAIYLVCFYAVTPVILAGLGSPQPLGQVVAFQLLLFFTASLAPTPGSSGAIELGAFSLFALIVPLAVLGTFLVWWRIMTFYINLVFGGPLFAYFLISKKWYAGARNGS